MQSAVRGACDRPAQRCVRSRGTICDNRCARAGRRRPAVPIDEIRLQVEQLLRLVDTPKPNDGALAALPVLSAIRPEHLKERRRRCPKLPKRKLPKRKLPKRKHRLLRVRAFPGRSCKLARADPTALVRAAWLIQISRFMFTGGNTRHTLRRTPADRYRMQRAVALQMSRVDMSLEHNRFHSFFTGVGWPTDKREWPAARALAQAG